MKLRIIFVLLLIVHGPLFAQTEPEKLSKLKAPTSPASVVIGSQPTAISRPKSWQALEAGLYSSYFNDGGNFIIPNDYAIEFTPYWTKKNNNISFDDFVKPGVALSLLQNLSFSISSTKSFSIADSLKKDAIGFGGRTMLWQGSRKELIFLTDGVTNIRMTNALKSLVSVSFNHLASPIPTAKADFIIKLISQVKSEKAAFLVGSPTKITASEADKWIKDLQKFLGECLPPTSADFSTDLNNCLDNFTKIASKAEALETLIKDRQGFKLEFATALALVFPTNQTDLSYMPRYSIWVTPSFQPFKDDHWEFLGVLRFNWLDQHFYTRYAPDSKFFENNFDFGGKLVYKWDKFSVELEGTGRNSKLVLSRTTDDQGITTEMSKSDNDFQYIANFSYRISDNLMLSYNFGKQFQPVLTYNGTLISMATLNFGIGGPKSDNLK